jgi:hypothetical protein
MWTEASCRNSSGNLAMITSPHLHGERRRLQRGALAEGFNDVQDLAMVLSWFWQPGLY